MSLLKNEIRILLEVIEKELDAVHDLEDETSYTEELETISTKLQNCLESHRTEIKDIKLSKDEDFLVKWNDLSANVYDDTRFFWAESFDGQDACSGMIVDAFENVNNENPTLCVMRVYKISQTVFKFQEKSVFFADG